MLPDKILLDFEFLFLLINGDNISSMLYELIWLADITGLALEWTPGKCEANSLNHKLIALGVIAFIK